MMTILNTSKRRCETFGMEMDVAKKIYTVASAGVCPPLGGCLGVGLSRADRSTTTSQGQGGLTLYLQTPLGGRSADGGVLTSSFSKSGFLTQR